MINQTIAEKIRQRRLQILVHSFIYYDLDDNIIDDATWSKWAFELKDLQEKFPEIADKVIYADTFRNFDGSSGCDLNYRTPEIMNKAYQLLRYRDKHGGQNGD